VWQLRLAANQSRELSDFHHSTSKQSAKTPRPLDQNFQKSKQGYFGQLRAWGRLSSGRHKMVSKVKRGYYFLGLER
jgi:hypothetical protein